MSSPLRILLRFRSIAIFVSSDVMIFSLVAFTASVNLVAFRICSFFCVSVNGNVFMKGTMPVKSRSLSRLLICSIDCTAASSALILSSALRLLTCTFNFDSANALSSPEIPSRACIAAKPAFLSPPGFSGVTVVCHALKPTAEALSMAIFASAASMTSKSTASCAAANSLVISRDST